MLILKQSFPEIVKIFNIATKTFTQSLLTLTHYSPSVTFLYPLKTTENL